jgi:phosphatidylglycerophosphate synthase
LIEMSGLYPLKAGGVFATILIVAAIGRRTHHPFARVGPANQVTAVRALLVALVAGLIGEALTPALAIGALAVSAVATALDGVDGWLARHTGMVSTFGARFDMEVDALLIQVLAVLVWQDGKAGVWVLASGLLRYAFVLAGRVWPWLRRPLSPTVRGKTICVVQILGLLIALLPIITPPASAIVAGVALAALVYSFAVDIAWLWTQRGGRARSAPTEGEDDMRRAKPAHEEREGDVQRAGSGGPAMEGCEGAR